MPAAVLLHLQVPGDPVPKGRPRLTVQGGHARAYTPAKTRTYEAKIADAARDAFNGEPYDCPLAVELHASLAVPKSWSKRKRAEALDGTVFPTGPRADCDNIAKAVLDALNGIVWRDDGQIVSLFVSKRYADVPGVCLEVLAA